jgi:antirestriction protein ArdC
VAQAVAHSSASKPSQQETVSRHQHVPLGTGRLWLAVLVDVSASAIARRQRPQGRARHENCLLEIRQVRDGDARRRDGETEKRKSAFLRYYTVFNLEQTDGLKALLALPPARPIESAEAIVAGMPNPPAFEQDSRAAYIPSKDTVTMPSRTAFNSQAEYYSTLFHELTHSTGHAKRLAREGFDKPQMFGSESYSKEELIAEMGSAMLCGVAGIEQSTVANSVAYLQSWTARLKGDSRLVVSAASAAQKAADYIRGESAKDSPVVSGESRAD